MTNATAGSTEARRMCAYCRTDNPENQDACWKCGLWASATYETIRVAGVVPYGVAATLRATTEEMANAACVPMEIWDRHSNAALAACAILDAQAAELARLTAANKRMRAGLEVIAEGHPQDYTDNCDIARAALLPPAPTEGEGQ